MAALGRERGRQSQATHLPGLTMWYILCCVMMQYEGALVGWWPAVGLPTLQNYKSNKLAFFIQYLASGILLQQKKMKEDALLGDTIKLLSYCKSSHLGFPRVLKNREVGISLPLLSTRVPCRAYFQVLWILMTTLFPGYTWEFFKSCKPGGGVECLGCCCRAV